jgi:hypothetical protein
VRQEVQAQRGVARERVRGVARQDVDLARLQRGEALLRGERHVLDLGASSEDRRGDGLAHVDVEAGPVALAVGLREAGEAGVHAADELAALLDGVDGLAGECGGGGNERGRGDRGPNGGSERFMGSPGLGIRGGACAEPM